MHRMSPNSLQCVRKEKMSPVNVTLSLYVLICVIVSLHYYYEYTFVQPTVGICNSTSAPPTIAPTSGPTTAATSDPITALTSGPITVLTGGPITALNSGPTTTSAIVPRELKQNLSEIYVFCELKQKLHIFGVRIMFAYFVV